MIRLPGFQAGVGAVLLLAAFQRAPAQLVLSEVLFDLSGVNTNRQVVEIQNTGSTDFHMGPSGYWLYFPAVGGTPPRWQFPAGVVIPAGGAITVHINTPGVSTEAEFYTGTSGMRNLRAKDALGLFRENLFGDPNQIVDFVQWGTAGHGGEDVADQAGLWTLGTFVDVESLREGSSIAYDGFGHSATDWCVDGSPSIGFPNDDCTVSFATSPVVLNEVGYVRTGPGAYHPAIELKNTSLVLEDLGGKWVTLGGEHEYQFPAGTLNTQIAPGEIAVVHLGVSGTDSPSDFYAGAWTFRGFLSADSVSFHAAKPFTDTTTIIDFVAWGGAGSPFEPQAVAAGLWAAGDFVDAADLRERGSIAASGPGFGSGRWSVDNTGTIGAENTAAPIPEVVLNEILIDPLGSAAGQGRLELRNVIDEVVDVSSFTLCAESQAFPGIGKCFSIREGYTIDPGEYLVINVNRSGLSNPFTYYTGPFQEINTSGDSYSLFVSPDIENPGNLIDYLGWGGSNWGEEMAVQAGIWTARDSLGVGDARDESSIAYFGGPGSTLEGSWGYRIDRTPSIGADNDEPIRFEAFRRGDCNDDGRVDVSDAITLLGVLFLGQRASLCEDACDSNDTDTLDISDPVHLLNYLFQGGSAPPLPGADACGGDGPGGSASVLSCNSFLSCS